jgi:hypothetical protein
MSRIDEICGPGDWKCKMRNWVLYYGSFFILLSSFFFLLYGSYLYSFDANPAVSMNTAPIPASIVGDYVVLNVSICRNTPVPAVVSRCFENSLVYCMPSEYVAGEGIGCYNLTRIIRVPYDLPSGTYKLLVKAQYQVNPLANRLVSWETTTFYVNNTNNLKR